MLKKLTGVKLKNHSYIILGFRHGNSIHFHISYECINLEISKVKSAWNAFIFWLNKLTNNVSNTWELFVQTEQSFLLAGLQRAKPVTSPLFAPTAVHMIAHLLNVEWYSNSRLGVYDNLTLALSNLEDDPSMNTTFLNPIRQIDLVSPTLKAIKSTPI